MFARRVSVERDYIYCLQQVSDCVRVTEGIRVGSDACPYVRRVFCVVRRIRGGVDEVMVKAIRLGTQTQQQGLTYQGFQGIQRSSSYGWNGKCNTRPDADGICLGVQYMQLESCSKQPPSKQSTAFWTRYCDELPVVASRDGRRTYPVATSIHTLEVFLVAIVLLCWFFSSSLF